MQERLKTLKKTYGSKELGKVTVDMAIGGMRGITVSLYHLDPGIHRRTEYAPFLPDYFTIHQLISPFLLSSVPMYQ
jgi:hypothetical protein